MGSGILKQIQARFGIESMSRRLDTKITLGITGLHEISGRDDGIEEPYWGPSEDIVCMEEGLYPHPLEMAR